MRCNNLIRLEKSRSEEELLNKAVKSFAIGSTSVFAISTQRPTTYTEISYLTITNPPGKMAIMLCQHAETQWLKCLNCILQTVLGYNFWYFQLPEIVSELKSIHTVGFEMSYPLSCRQVKSMSVLCFVSKLLLSVSDSPCEMLWPGTCAHSTASNVALLLKMKIYSWELCFHHSNQSRGK